MNTKKKPLITKQKPMRKMLYALAPLCLAAVYFFGWRFLAVLAIVNIAGFLTEYLFNLVYKKPVSEAVFVSNVLFALSLPPMIPYWIAVVGIVAGIMFGKMVFGGFGRNVFNPALTGRAFIYISFGVPLTAYWFEPFHGLPGGFASWITDAVSQATPLARLASGETVSRLALLLGNTSGSFGETSALLIILAALYLFYTKTANYRIVVSGILSFTVFQAIFHVLNVQGIADPLSALLSGSFLFGMVFMATDPVSASQTTDAGRWIYGALIGFLCFIIRGFSAWPESLTFAILLANMFAPLLDHLIKERKTKKAVSQ